MNTNTSWSTCITTKHSSRTNQGNAINTNSCRFLAKQLEESHVTFLATEVGWLSGTRFSRLYSSTVKTYFGGREISAEDLERALLVGMSPHEIRRLEKKKGLNLRRYKESNFHTLSGTSLQANGHDSSAENNSKESLEYGDNSEIGNGQKSTSTNEIDVDLLSRVHEDISFINGVDQNDSVEILHEEKGQNGYGDPSDETGNPSDGTVINHKSSTSHQVLSSKSAKKLSLLGHGPHGKQVVEHLLSKYGEDGIGKFCQRWRQVFVESVHPRFLPLGWDIMHSGRRDFGDFSVYNPAKRPS